METGLGTNKQACWNGWTWKTQTDKDENGGGSPFSYWGQGSIEINIMNEDFHIWKLSFIFLLMHDFIRHSCSKILLNTSFALLLFTSVKTNGKVGICVALINTVNVAS